MAAKNRGGLANCLQSLKNGGVGVGGPDPQNIVCEQSLSSLPIYNDAELSPKTISILMSTILPYQVN